MKGGIHFHQPPTPPSQDGWNIKALLIITAIAIFLPIALLIIIILVFFPGEKIDYVKVILSLLVFSAICISFILALSKAYRNISLRIILIILIPLCMFLSVASASVILNKPFSEVVKRILLVEIEEKSFPVDQNDIMTQDHETKRDKPTAPKPDEDKSNKKPTERHGKDDKIDSIFVIKKIMYII